MFTIARTTTAIATTAAAVTYFAPAAAIPVDIPAPRIDTVTIERPCYMARPGWNTPAGWEQPVCETEIRTPAADTAPAGATAVRRPVEDFMP